MRVLYFHQHFTTPDGSGGTRSYEFARALVAKGHRVTMVCGYNERSLAGLPWNQANDRYEGVVDGIDVIALPLAYSNRVGLLRRAWLFLRFAWRGVSIMLRQDYDLLFATSTPLTAAIPGIVAKIFRRRKPFVFEVRDLWPELPRALGMKNPFALWGMSVLEWLAYRSADACIGLSPGIVEGIKRRAPAGRRVEMVPNGCDLELFRPLAEKQTGDQREFVAGFTGAHGIANGLGALLDAAAEIKRAGRPDIRLVLIGDGNQKDLLMQRAEREHLDNVHFLPPIRKTEIARVTADFDCGLMILADVRAFYFGTSPNKFFDYISSGIPVVNNYPGWLAGMIAENDCGVAVPPGNPAALAAALIRLADEPATVVRMGANARRLAEMEFGRERLAGSFVEIIESLG